MVEVDLGRLQQQPKEMLSLLIEEKIGRLEMLLSLGLGHTGEVSGTMSEPSAYNWARTLESDAGRQIYCCALEIGGGETELEQSRMGLNGLLLLSLGAYNAFKWKRLDSNCSL